MIVGTMTCTLCQATVEKPDLSDALAWAREHVCSAGLPGRILTREEVGYSVGIDAGKDDLVKTAMAYHDLRGRIPTRDALAETILGYEPVHAPVRARADALTSADKILALLHVEVSQ